MTQQIAKPAAGTERSTASLQRLALLYEGILTVVVRVQSGRQQVQDADAFQTRMKEALSDISQVAARRGYTREDVEEANFAVVAFLDEVILSSQDGGQTQWARKSLQEEMFGQRSAGELFFKRLEELRAQRDSQQLAEVLEVYQTCLLLGYEGRHSMGAKAELHQLMDNLRDRIERILGRHPEFSPDGAFPDLPPEAERPDPFPRQLLLGTIAVVAFTLLCFLGFSWHLSSRVGDIRQAVEQQMIAAGR
jgi:type VI secretion system protein ImpK